MGRKNGQGGNLQRRVLRRKNGYRSSSTTAPSSKRRRIGIDSLPVEMMDEIFSKMDLDSKKVARQVCRTWQKLIDPKMSFRVALSDATFDAVDNFDTNQPIEELVVHDCLRKISPSSCSRSNFTKTVNHLTFKTGEGTFVNPPLRETVGSWERNHCTNWIPGSGTSGENILTLLRLLSSIKSLTVRPMAFEKVSRPFLLQRIRLDCLTRLEISFGDDVDEYLIQEKTSIRPYQQLLKNSFPSLSTFSYSCKADYKPFQILIDVYFFIAQHRSTLTYLTVDSFESYLFTMLENSSINPERFENLRQEVCSLQLKELYIRVISFVPVSFRRWSTLEHDFIRSQVRVEKLEIVSLENLHSTLNFLPNCKDTLVDLTISTNLLDLIDEDQMWETADKFDCTLIKDCNRLERLELGFAEWDYFQQCSRARVKNFQYLPKSLTTLTLGGYLSNPDGRLLSHSQSNLQSFSAHGSGSCEENLQTVYNFLKYSKVQSFSLLNDACMMVINFATSLINTSKGVELDIDEVEGITIRVDRNIFNASFLAGQ